MTHSDIEREGCYVCAGYSHQDVCAADVRRSLPLELCHGPSHPHPINDIDDEGMWVTCWLDGMEVEVKIEGLTRTKIKQWLAEYDIVDEVARVAELIHTPAGPEIMYRR